jgi:hypothetical protein
MVFKVATKLCSRSVVPVSKALGKNKRNRLSDCLQVASLCVVDQVVQLGFCQIANVARGVARHNYFKVHLVLSGITSAVTEQQREILNYKIGRLRRFGSMLCSSDLSDDASGQDWLKQIYESIIRSYDGR